MGFILLKYNILYVLLLRSEAAQLKNKKEDEFYRKAATALNYSTAY